MRSTKVMTCCLCMHILLMGISKLVIKLLMFNLSLAESELLLCLICCLCMHILLRLRFEQYLVYGKLHLWQRNMKLLEEKCWLMMKMMMVGWLHMGNRKVKISLVFCLIRISHI